MLVLSRKVGERIIVRDRETGAKFALEIGRIRGDRVRVAFDAEQRFEILREEIAGELAEAKPR